MSVGDDNAAQDFNNDVDRPTGNEVSKDFDTDSRRTRCP